MSIESISRADEIVTELVSYSTSTNLDLTLLDLNQFAIDSLNLMSEEFDTYDVKVNREFGDDVKALISPSELQQVFLNLMFNALQAMGAGGALGEPGSGDRSESLHFPPMRGDCDALMPMRQIRLISRI